jgi:hypothetical protein
LERGDVLTLRQEIQLKWKSHPLNGSNSVVIGQPKSQHSEDICSNRLNLKEK